MADVLERLQSALAGRYSVESEIGRGGMATVFIATDLKHDRRVAVKVIHPGIAATLGTDRFLREIQIAARLEHPHILSLYDSGDADGLPFYVMPFVEGESLADRLEREGPLPIEEALEIAGEVADGLAYAHRQGVIHRDIKPGNILLAEGHALIADFGVGRAIDAASEGDATATGLAVGTPKYMSPEQAAGAAQIDGRTDVYALGCVVWEMLAGEPPFDGPTPSAILARKVTADAPRIGLRRKTVPPELENVLARSMATEPADRFQTAGEFAAALEAPETVGRVRPRGKLARRLATAAVAVLLVGAGVWLARTFAGEPGGDEGLDLDPDYIAVLPFAEPGGSSPESLTGQEATYLLYAKLGLGEFRSASPSDVAAAVGRECGAIADAACVSAVGRSLGAGILVTGEAVEAGGRLHLSARVHNVAGGETTEPVSVEGDPSEALPMVNELARRLLPGFAGDDAERLFSMAPLTTDSLRAAKAFFEGNRLMRENSQTEAVEALSEAVEIDSTFALAWYRLALAADWDGQNELSIQAAARATELSEALPARERGLLEGFHSLKVGESERAESVFRGILRDYPADNDARFFLAWVLHFRNWTRARPVAEALPYLRAVVLDDPGYGPAEAHYVPLVGASGAWGELDSLLRLPGREDYESLILLAAASGDTVELQLALAETRAVLSEGVAWSEEAWAALHLFDVVGHAGMARALLLEPLLPKWPARKGYPSLAFGKLEEAEREYREVEERGIEPEGVNPLLARTWLHTLPFLPVEDRLPGLYDVEELDEWMSSGMLNSEYLPATYWRALYVKGLLVAMRGGSPGEVMEAVHELESYTGSDSVRIPERLALGLRAQLHWQRGQLEEALEAIESMPELRREGSGMHWPMAGGWRELYLRAEILRLLGRLDEAEAWFQHSVGYRFPAESFLKRGEIAEARGDTEQAIEWYGKFVLLWEDADDWLQPRVDEVRTRIERLEAGA